MIMAARRKDLVDFVAEAVGPRGILVRSASTGWPAEVDVLTETGRVPVSLHVGPIGASHRGRDTERRFQNPGSNRPVSAPGGSLPVLLGVWTELGKTVFVGLDGRERVNRPTRFSLFMPLHVLRAAAATGWVEHFNTADEKVVAFLPGLLPIYVQLLQSDVEIEPKDVSTVIAAAGMTDMVDAAAERGRRTVSTLIRDAVFSRTVRQAYGGLCAMCGLNFSLVIGAHILPVAAPEAPDEAWNGIALCHNHHAVFDAHKLHVDPDTLSINVHPELSAGRGRSEACREFVDRTYAKLSLPSESDHKPRREMFVKRYEFFPSKYEWVDS